MGKGRTVEEERREERDPKRGGKNQQVKTTKQKGTKTKQRYRKKKS